MTAMGAAGCGCRQAYFNFFLTAGSVDIKKFMTLLPPFSFQHDWQAVDDDIEKAAYTKAEQNNGCIKQPLFCLEYVEYFQKGLML